MRKLKLRMDNTNYMCIGNTHIFINFNHSDLELLNTLNPRSIEKVHVFITTHASINATLKHMIGKYKKMVIDGEEHRVKIIIHLPHQIRDLTYLIKQFLGWEQDGYKLIVERVGPRFRVSGPRIGTRNNPNYLLDITYGQNSLWINTIGSRTSCPVMIKFPEYHYNINDRDNDPGIFETGEMRLNPEMFKDKLIEGFKKSCPEGILKSFGTDEEIWDYIMERGVWGVEDGLPPGGLRIKHPDTSIKAPSSAIGIVGHGHSPLTQILTTLGHKDIGNIVVGDELIDSNNNKIIVIDSLGGFPNLPKMECVAPKPEQSYMDEFSPYHPTRNRAERRAAKKRGGK